MDRYDPNDWNTRFVSREPEFCMQVLRQTNATVIELLEAEEFAPAVAGMDRILNGLITFLNAGAKVRPHLCFFSWMLAEIAAFGVDAPEDRRKKVAIGNLEDARDFAGSEGTKDTLSQIIREMKSRDSLARIQQRVDPDFPESVIDMLNDLQEKLVV